MIDIDGSLHSGSGTIVRQAVAYAALTGQPVRIRNARARRRHPGPRPQHLRAIEAICELTGGTLDGAGVASRRRAVRRDQPVHRPRRRPARCRFRPFWSKSALAWAVRQAELTGAVVEAVTAWELPATSGLDPQLYLDYPAAAAKMLTDAIAKLGGRATVHPRVKPGHAAQVLAEAPAGAKLLVVGSGGHGGFLGTLVGRQFTRPLARPPVLATTSPPRRRREP